MMWIHLTFNIMGRKSDDFKHSSEVVTWMCVVVVCVTHMFFSIIKTDFRGSILHHLEVYFSWAESKNGRPAPQSSLTCWECTKLRRGPQPARIQTGATPWGTERWRTQPGARRPCRCRNTPAPGKSGPQTEDRSEKGNLYTQSVQDFIFSTFVLFSDTKTASFQTL